MAARNSVDIVTQIGVETTPGTEVDATKKLTAVMLAFSARLEARFQRANGSRLITSGVKNKGWAEGSFEGIASYEELAVILEGLIGRNGAVINPYNGQAAAYGRVFDSNTWSNQKTFTAERGDSSAAMVATNVQLSTLQMRFGRDEVTCSGNLFAKEPNNAGTLTLRNEQQTITITGTPTGGTFTLTYNGQTTGNIAYNASAANVVTALEALSNIGAGDVTATGGALPGTPVVVTFANALAGANQPLMTANAAGLTGGTSPAVTVAETTPGGYQEGYNESPISGNEVCVYVDTTAAALGTTLLTDGYTVEFSIPEVAAPKWVLNCTVASFKESVKLAIENTTLNLTAEFNAQTRALYDAWNANSLPIYFVRIKCTGPIIAGAVANLAQFDFAVKLESVEELADQDGTYGYQFGFRVIEDQTWGKGFEFLLVNELAAI
jgi:hypothetical protein